MRLIDADVFKQYIIDGVILEMRNARDSLEKEMMKSVAYGILEDIDNQPTVDAEPVVHAHWDSGDYPKNIATVFRCSRCGRYIKLKGIEILADYPYCHCGAKMMEEGNREKE